MREKLNIFKEDGFKLKETLVMLLFIAVISGIIGFIYETIFYKIDLGYFVKRGSSYGPWIPIYAVGGFFIVLLTYKLKKHPILVFLANCLITGILEYGTGYVLDQYFGIRLWDYNVEIWNFGNINGYICARSILCFGLSGVMMIYWLVPLIQRFRLKISEKRFELISLSLTALFLVDVIAYQIFK